MNYALRSAVIAEAGGNSAHRLQSVGQRDLNSVGLERSTCMNASLSRRGSFPNAPVAGAGNYDPTIEITVRADAEADANVTVSRRLRVAGVVGACPFRVGRRARRSASPSPAAQRRALVRALQPSLRSSSEQSPDRDPPKTQQRFGGKTIRDVHSHVGSSYVAIPGSLATTSGYLTG